MISTILADPAPWVALVDAAIVLALAIVAVTPTDKDDGVAQRVSNVWAKVRAVFWR